MKVLNIIMRDGTVVSPTDKNYPFKRVLYMYTATALEVSKTLPSANSSSLLPPSGAVIAANGWVSCSQRRVKA